MAIRTKSTLNGIENHAITAPTGVSIFADSVSAYVEIVTNPDAITGGTWTDVDTASSGTETNLTATGITGGKVIGSFHVSAANKSASVAAADLLGKSFLGLFPPA